MKIHALVDVFGRPLRLALKPGNTSDIKGADLLLGETVGKKRLIADCGDDANGVRAILQTGHDPDHPEQTRSQVAQPL